MPGSSSSHTSIREVIMSPMGMEVMVEVMVE